MKENNAILRLENVGFQADETILNNISFQLAPGNLS
jgi:ABC-type Mn2+/Zn2+ transport system ATPase subunit